MPDELSKLLESTKRLYKSGTEETINRLTLIRKSSLLDERIKSAIDPILERLKEKAEGIENSKDFRGIHELEWEVRAEEKTLELLENAVSTFISNRTLSTTLSILFEHLYHEVTNNKLPFLVISREGEALQTYPSLRDENNELIVGVIGIPLYSVSHTSEWILAGHEFGHIIAHKKLGVGIEYKTHAKTQAEYESCAKSNYMMETLADFTALQIFGPVFLEVLLTKFIGAEPGYEEVSITHPPIPWRIKFCYDQASYFERKNFNEEFKERGAKDFKGAIEGVINERYPGEEYKKYKGVIDYNKIKKEHREISESKFEEIRNIGALKECYKKAYEVSDKLESDEHISPDNMASSYSPDQIVIGGYLASRERPAQFKSYTQKVIDALIRKK